MTARVRDRKGIGSSTYMGFIGEILSTKGKDFVPSGCDTYFIESNPLLLYGSIVLLSYIMTNLFSYVLYCLLFLLRLMAINVSV